MSSAQTVAPAPAVPAARTAGWVVGPRFDLPFFILPPALTALFLLAHLGLDEGSRFAVSAVFWVALAQSHFGATALFFLERSNRRHYASAPLTYLLVPAVLIAAYVVAGFTPAAGLALMLVPFASFWHGNRQSFGVSGLYRGASRSFDPWTRRLELAVVFSGNACFTALGVARLGMLGAFGWSVERIPTLVAALWWFALAAASAILIAAEWNAYRQGRAAGVSPWPRMCVLAASWAMYLPYVVAQDVLGAYLAALIPHYLQYHGLLYLIFRNKLEAGVLDDEPLARAAVRDRGRYAACTIAFALLLGGALLVSRALGRVEVGLALVAGINMAHFWLDSFFWRFRDPHARAATLAWLRPRPGEQPA